MRCFRSLPGLTCAVLLLWTAGMPPDTRAQQDDSGVKYGKVYVSGENPVIRLLLKEGDTLTQWKETVKSDKYTVELVWRDFAEPFQLDTPSGGKTNPYGITPFFIPAKAAEVVINGRKAAGRPFPVPRGRMRNSTAFPAFSET